MEKVSWWQGGSWWERSKLNEAAEDINALADNSVMLGERIGQAFVRLNEQAREIMRLKAVLKAVVDTLEAGEGVDPKVLGYRIEAALSALEPAEAPAPTAAAGGSPYRGEAPEAVAPEVTVPSGPPAGPEPTTTCVGCGGSFLLSRTNVTDAGNLCDACFSKLG